ncbi:MAG: type II and III secretion system protein family protein [Devosia sp.]
MTIVSPMKPRGHQMTWLRAVTAIALTVVLAAPALAAQTAYLRVPHTAAGATQELSLEVNKSILVDLPTNAGEVIASQPAVANVVMRSKTRAIIQGVAAGDTNIFFLDPAGNNIAVFDVKVIQTSGGGGASDIGPALESALARNLQGSRIRIESVTLDDPSGATTNRVVLTGTVRSQDDLAKAVLMAVQFAGGEGNVANLLTISGNQQVKLKVTVAEVSRDTVKQLGINLDGALSIGPVTLGLESQPATGGASGVANNNGVSLGYDDGMFSLEASLRALERRGALRTLAEPTLTAISGQPASFLAGGEFPVPTGVSGGEVSYTFKEFGVKLSFTPTVKSNGIIGLVVDTSVSELTTEGGFSIGGITIPATKNRQATTSVEMGSGQTLAIAGMLQDTIRQQINQLPGLGNIPILGALFRSRDFIHSQTELIILVTPYFAEPGYDVSKPTDNMQVAGDAEAIFLGHLEKLYGVGDDGMRGTYNGSVGFVLD